MSTGVTNGVGRKATPDAAKTRKARTPVPKDETKAQKFKRLGDARVKTALAKLRLIGNLGGSGYEYTADEISKINTALAKRVGDVVQALEAGLNKSAPVKAAEDFAL